MATNETKGTLLVLLTALISGFSIVVNKFFVVNIDPILFTAIRALFIGVVFFFISLHKNKFRLRGFKRASWNYLLAIGVIGGGIAFWLFFSGLKMTTAGRAAFLHKTLPLYSTILAFFFLKERIPKKLLIAMMLMIVGVFVMEFDKIGYEIKFGDLLVITATVMWAMENTIAKMVMMYKESNWVVTFSRMFFGSLVLFSILFLMGRWDLLFALTSQQILYIAISTLILTGYVLTWYWGLRFINLSKASTILLISPIISLALGYFLFNESVLLLQLIGSALILVGAYFVLQVKSERSVLAREYLPKSLT
jgi:drug/metabolite transporter (DMT)-like permease